MFRFLMMVLMIVLLAAYALIPSAESAWRRLRQPRYRNEPVMVACNGYL